MASPLLDLIVKISVQGTKEVDKALAGIEAKAKAVDDKLTNLGKNTEKSSKQTAKGLNPIVEALDKITKSQKEWNDELKKNQKANLDALKKISNGFKDIDASAKPLKQTTEDLAKGQEAFARSSEQAAKRSSASFKEMLRGLVGIRDVTTELNKTGVKIKTELSGATEVRDGLMSIKRVGEDLERGTITITTDLRGGEQVLSELEGIEGVTARIDGDEVAITVDLHGGPEAQAQIEALERSVSGLDGDQINIDLELHGAVEAVSELEAVEIVRDRLDGNDVRFSVKIDNAIQATKELLELNTVGQHATSTLKTLSSLVLGGARTWPVFAIAIGAVIALFGPLTAGITAIAAGLGVVAATVGIAAGGFGLLVAAAIPVIKALQDGSDATKTFEARSAKLAEAQRKAAEAVAKYGENSTQAAKAQSAVAKAQEELNATATQQVSYVEQLAEKWQGLKDAFNESFAASNTAGEALAGVGVKVLDLATRAMPKLGESAGKVAVAFSVAFDKVIEALNGPVEQSAIARFFDAMPGVVANLTEAVGNFGASLINILGEAVGPAENLAGWIKDISERLLEWTRSEEGRAQLKQFFENAAPVAKALGEAVATIAKELTNLDAEDVRDFAQAIKDTAGAIKAVMQVASGISGVFNEIGDAINFVNEKFDAAGKAGHEFIARFEPGGEYDGVVGTWLDTNVDQPFYKFVAKLKPGGEYSGVVGDWISGEFSEEETTKAESGAQQIASGIAKAWDWLETDTDQSFGQVRKNTDKNLGGAASDSTARSNSIKDILSKAWAAVSGDTEKKFSAAKKSVTTNLSDASSQGGGSATELEDTATNAWTGLEKATGKSFPEIKKAVVDNLSGARGEGTPQATEMQTEVTNAWSLIEAATGKSFPEIKKAVVDNLTGARGEGTPQATDMQTEVTNAWSLIEAATGKSFPEIKRLVVDNLTGAATEGTPQADNTQVKVNNAWDLIEQHTGLTWPKIKKWVVDNITGANEEAGSKSDDAKTKVNNAWDLIEEHTGITWPSVKNYVVEAVGTIVSKIRGDFSSAIDYAIGKLGALKRAAEGVLSFLGTGTFATPGNMPVSTNANAPAKGFNSTPASNRAKGGVDDNAEPQGPTGGVSDGLTPRVIYGEQKRKVKEAYIVEDREDNVPYLAEAASWHGYGLVKMAKGGKITSGNSTQNITADGSASGSGTTPGGATGAEPAVVPSPTPSEQQPYTDAALGQYAMIPVPAADYVGDHVNVPDTTTSGDLGGVARGGSVPSVWPSLTMTAGPTASVGPWAKAGPAFAMATGGMTGGTSSGAAAKPVPYTGVPVNWWDTFLGASWTGDPALDWPVLYPPSGWDPSAVFAPAAMARGGILRRGTRYFQGGGLNQSQIDVGIQAGTAAIGSPYSYGSAGEDGGYDCAGIWNWIESAVAYGNAQTGKRWGTYDAAAGSAGSFTTPGLTPGGVNIGVNLSGEGGPDDTHMAGDIGGTTFESTVPTGVTNGRGADSFGTQYTMGGAGDVAGQVGPGQSFDPASNMTQQVADWWNSAYGQSPSTDGTTPTATNSQSNTQTDIQKVNNDTGQTSSSGGSGSGSGTGSSGEDPESSGTGTGSGGNLRGPGRGGGRGHRGGIPSRGTRKKARKRNQRRYRRQHRMAGGGILMDGVENWMASLPGATQDYLTNVGLQTLGTLGGVSSSPLGSSTRDWVIAGLEAAGLDPTEEAIGILESLIGAESGGDPNAVSPDGAQGILQLMPETWDSYNVGGSVTDPVANIAASIRYQLARYGQLVNFSPYEKGGMALSPHLGMVGEAGNEVMLPLENRMVMSSLRAGLGTGDLEASIGQLAKHVDRVAERVDHQTDVIPERTGVAVGGGVDKRIVRNPKTRKAIISSGDVEARRALHAGR